MLALQAADTATPSITSATSRSSRCRGGEKHRPSRVGRQGSKEATSRKEGGRELGGWLVASWVGWLEVCVEGRVNEGTALAETQRGRPCHRGRARGWAELSNCVSGSDTSSGCSRHSSNSCNRHAHAAHAPSAAAPAAAPRTAARPPPPQPLPLPLLPLPPPPLLQPPPRTAGATWLDRRAPWRSPPASWPAATSVRVTFMVDEAVEDTLDNLGEQGVRGTGGACVRVCMCC